MGRRACLAALLVAVLLGCGGVPAAPGGSQSQTPAQPTTAPTAPPSPTPPLADVFDELVDVLAESGVEVYADESAAEPLTTIEEPVFAVTRWQLENMAAEALAGNGMPGADIDATIPMPEGTPPFSFLLAAWISLAESPGSAWLADLYGEQDWTQAQAIGFPTLALTLFVADAARAAQAEEDAALSVTAVRVTAARAPGAAVRVAQLDRPCSTVTEFVDKALAYVFNALKVDPQTFGTSIPGQLLSFLTGIWNLAVNLAQDVIQGAIKELTAEVVSAVRSALAVAATVSVVVSYLKPWTINVAAAPGSVHKSVAGGATSTGEFIATADTRVDQWPPAIADCAAAVGVQPPTLAAAGAPITWQVTFGGDLITPSVAGPPYTGILDQQKRARLPFTAVTEPADLHDGGGEVTTSSVRASAQVERKEVTQLLQMAEQAVYKSIPGGELVQRVVETLLAPQIKQMLDGVRARLPALLRATGFGVVDVTSHEPAQTPSPSASSASNPVWVHFDRPSAPGVPPLRMIELYSCDGPWGTWRGTFRVGGLSQILETAGMPFEFTVGGDGEQTVRVTTETYYITVPGAGEEPIYADVDVRISADGRTMTFIGRPGIDNIFEPEEGMELMSLPIEPQPAPAKCEP